MLQMLLCHKVYLLCVPYSPCYTGGFHRWAWAGCGEGHPFVCPFSPSWPYSSETRCLQLFHTFPWWAQTSSSERSVLGGKKDGHLLNISAWPQVPPWMLPAEICLPAASTSVLSWALSSSHLWSSLSPVLLMLSAVLSFFLLSLPLPISFSFGTSLCLSPLGFLSPLQAGTSDSRNFMIWHAHTFCISSRGS